MCIDHYRITLYFTRITVRAGKRFFFFLIDQFSNIFTVQVVRSCYHGHKTKPLYYDVVDKKIKIINKSRAILGVIV